MLKICAESGLKLHPRKYSFFQKSAKRCGKVVSSGGVQHCPEKISGLVNMSGPDIAVDLQEHLCVLNGCDQVYRNTRR